MKENFSQNSRVNDNSTQRFIPLEMDRETYNTLAGAKDYEYQKIRIGVRDTYGILVPATEQQYQVYVRELQREEKRIERERRCWVKSPKTGRLIKCTKPCSKCDKLKDGAPLSLDSFKDEDGYETADAPCAEDHILGELLVQQCRQTLYDHKPILATIFDELCNDVSQRGIADIIGKSHRYTRDLIDEMREILSEVVSREDLLD